MPSDGEDERREEEEEEEEEEKEEISPFPSKEVFPSPPPSRAAERESVFPTRESDPEALLRLIRLRPDGGDPPEEDITSTP